MGDGSVAMGRVDKYRLVVTADTRDEPRCGGYIRVWTHNKMVRWLRRSDRGGLNNEIGVEIDRVDNKFEQGDPVNQ